MGILEKWFGFKPKVEKEVDKKGRNDIYASTSQFTKDMGIPDVALLSYGNGVYVMPVDAIREGLKRGVVKGYCNDKGFVSLSSLGKELLLFDPEYGHTIPLMDSTNPKFDDIKREIYGG